jgi:hypothetical protein
VNRYSGDRITLDLLAQVADVDVDRAWIAVRRVAPYLLQQHLTRLHAPGEARERRQDLELDVCQPHPLAANGDDSALEVDPQIPGRDRLLAPGPPSDHLRAPQRRPDAAAKLAHGEGLGV